MLTLYEFDPERDGGCPCAHGELEGVKIDAYCWRTGPQPAGLGVVVYGSRDQAIILGAQVAAAQLDLWPGMQVYVYTQSDTDTPVLHIPEEWDA